ncbi:MAG: DNA adenine methylase [Dermatophilaceae bacterium]
MEQLSIRASRRYGTLSPLRYPGGKAALAGLFADLISRLGIARPVYVEPYAGGAGAGVALLRQGLVRRLVINDFDPAVHAFWRSAIENNAELVELVRTAPLTVDEWRRQREVYRGGDVADLLALGFSFFYLNRTNRSGVLRGGVIGGLSQAGQYKIDARFNRQTLAERILALGALADRITVSDLDGRSVIRTYAHDPSVFMYIDPPYVRAGSRLYLNAFDAHDHQALARIVDEVDGAHWLMTYDVASLIQKMYAHHFQGRYELNYSARHPGFTDELMIASPAVATALLRGWRAPAAEGTAPEAVVPAMRHAPAEPR